MDTLAAGAKVDRLTVLSRRENGGGVVRIPLARVAQGFDFSRTAGGGESGGSITDDMLSEMVVNFSRYPGPVPIGVSPHVEQSSERAGPALGYIEAVRMRDGVLEGDVSLGPVLFALVVDQEGFRGFSIEAARDLRLPAVELSGWALTGGVFTNRPSLDVNFRIAASAAIAAAECMRTSVLQPRSVGEKETGMSEDMISMSAHQARVKDLAAERDAKAAQVDSLSAEADNAKQRLQAAEARAGELDAKLKQITAERDALNAGKVSLEARVKSLETAKTALAERIETMGTELDAERDKNVAAEVRTIIEQATDPKKGKLPPAVFDGWETDPAAWLKSNFASLEAFRTRVKALCGAGVVTLETAPKSGAKAGQAPELKGEDKRPEFDGTITSEKQAQALLEAQAEWDKTHGKA